MRWIAILCAAAALAGCSKSLDPQIDFKPPEYVSEMPSKDEEDTSKLGSLFGRGDNPLFSDRKAMKINDILTVLIEERAQSNSSGRRQLDKSQQGQLNPMAISYGGGAQGGKNLARDMNNAVSFGVTTNANSQFSGGGTTSRTENFTTTISARVVKVMQNGNYFIEGRREILIDDEKQIIQISGVVRPDDIMQNNTIGSSYIADAKISYRTEGDIKRNTKQGWGARLLDTISPF